MFQFVDDTVSNKNESPQNKFQGLPNSSGIRKSVKIWQPASPSSSGTINDIQADEESEGDLNEHPAV